MFAPPFNDLPDVNRRLWRPGVYTLQYRSFFRNSLKRDREVGLAQPGRRDQGGHLSALEPPAEQDAQPVGLAQQPEDLTQPLDLVLDMRLDSY
jgi:hypothetical protein